MSSLRVDHWLCWLAVVLLTAAWSGPVSAAEPAPRLNVLFIVADDLRTELGCYGSPALTPNVDKLAQRGVQFNRAYCQQALCNPSRSSFLTGRRPDTLHQWSNGQHFRERNPDVVTLPQWFKEHGYVTRDVGKIFHNWHTKVKGDPKSWSAEAFLYYANHGDNNPLIDEPLPANLAKAPNCRQYDVPDEAYYDGRVAAEAIKVMGEIKDKPFFLAVGFWKPHAPMDAPKKYWDRYDRAKLPAVDLNRPKGAPDIAFHPSAELRGLPPKQIDFSPDDVREIRHGYFANTSYMDTQLGKVIAALDSHKLADSTIIVFCADHGYHLGEHGLWGKTSCFELDARVPLVIIPPGTRQAGKKTDSLVEMLDMFPTLVDLCGLPKLDGLEGTSLRPVLDDPAKTVKPAALTQHPRPAYYDRTKTGLPDAMGYSIRTAKVRYTEWRDWTTGKVLGAELYDHVGDPAETRNVIDAPPNANDLAEAKELLNKAVPPDVPPAKR
jgi:iduronate 2-sulfatase